MAVIGVIAEATPTLPLRASSPVFHGPAAKPLAGRSSNCMEQPTNPSIQLKMATQKQYIGSGKATKFDGVAVTLRMEDAQKFVRETESGKWLTFIVSPRRTVDEKGRSHNAFILVDAQPEEPQAPEQATVVAEPAETPIGTKVKKVGRSLRRISKKEAAELKAKA